VVLGVEVVVVVDAGVVVDVEVVVVDAGAAVVLDEVLGIDMLSYDCK